MRSARNIGFLLAGLLLCAVQLSAQDRVLEALGRTARVAVLPFSNYAEVPDALPVIMHQVLLELERKKIGLAEAPAIAEMLRANRIRNTSELTTEQMQALARGLRATYLLVGSVDRYVQGEEGAEIALSARLIHIPTLAIEWTGSAWQHTRDGVHLLEIGREDSLSGLSQIAVEDLFRNFRYKHPEDRRTIEWVELQGRVGLDDLPSNPLVVVPFGNESDLNHAGAIVSNHVIAMLDQAGYQIVESGLTREAMLDAGDVSPGRASAELLQVCREKLGVGLILTGMVSEFSCATPLGTEQIPAVSVEARLIDVLSGEVVWAETFRRDGEDSRLVFGTGTTYSAADVARHVAAKMVKTIPASRARRT